MSAEEREVAVQGGESAPPPDAGSLGPANETAPEANAHAPLAEDSAAAVPAEAPPAAARPGRPAVAGVRDGLAAAELLGVLAALFPAGTPSRHWCACLETIGPLAVGLPADLAGWTEGRAWSARAELRWQEVAPGRFSALYLGEDEALPAGFAPLAPELRALPGEDAAGIFLWGRRGDDGRYHATRLPRPLDYPAAGGAPDVRLPYQRLVGPDGVVRFLRLTLGEES